MNAASSLVQAIRKIAVGDRVKGEPEEIEMQVLSENAVNEKQICVTLPKKYVFSSSLAPTNSLPEKAFRSFPSGIEN